MLKTWQWNDLPRGSPLGVLNILDVIENCCRFVKLPPETAKIANGGE